MADHNTRIMCWNINGIRAAWKKGLPDWFHVKHPIFFVYRKLKRNTRPTRLRDPPSSRIIKVIFLSAEKKGYSGVAIYTQLEPKRVVMGLNNPVFDGEGRVIEMEFVIISFYSMSIFPTAVEDQNG
jgi:exodeoxyribonuclease-3